jgi:hypothetical protein
MNPPAPTAPIILSIDPNLIDLAPELSVVPMLSAVASHYTAQTKNAKAVETGREMQDELEALFSSLRAIGIQEPIKASKLKGGRWKAWDGRHRLLFAAQEGLESVPLVEVTEDEGRAFVEASVIGRRHWTKGQRAYLEVLLHPEVCGNAHGRPGKAHSVNFSMDDLATRCGVSVGLMHQACELYRKFHAPGAKAGSPEAIEAEHNREKYEMAIWSGAGLGAVIAGIAGGNLTLNAPRPETSFAALDKPFGTLVRIGKLFDGKWDEDEKKKAMKVLSLKVRELPASFRTAFAEAIAAAEFAA